jgi:hypothetical protein
MGARELDAIFAPFPPAFGAPRAWIETTRACPECGEVLVHVGLAGVPVERCLAHGVWFDRAELELAVDTAATGGSRDAPIVVRAPAPSEGGDVAALLDAIFQILCLFGD